MKKLFLLIVTVVIAASATVTSYKATFAATTDLEIAGATHNLGTCSMHVQIWDTTHQPRTLIEPDSASCNDTNFNLSIHFSTPQAGVVVLLGVI